MAPAPAVCPLTGCTTPRRAQAGSGKPLTLSLDYQLLYEGGYIGIGVSDRSANF